LVTCPCESVARTTKLDVPTVVGVPLIAPFEKVSPDGRLPLIRLRVYGGTPFTALMLAA
jgi:hypothetical protein